MTIDYHAIGKRIRIARIRVDMSQEMLAEKAQLSISHISNIENGKTKLSLPTIIEIATVLSTSVDELLCDNVQYSKSEFENEILSTISGCSEYEMRMLIDSVKGIKTSLRKNAIYK